MSTTPEQNREFTLDEILSETYACSRVWEAWSYNTMTADDFVPAAETEVREELERWRDQAIAAELEAIATRFEVNASDVAAWAEVQDDHDRLPGEGEAGAYATEAESLRKRIAELKAGVDEPAESAEPRTWHKGGTIPADVHAVIDEPGYRWDRRYATDWWVCEDEDFEPRAFLTEMLLASYGPVTEAGV